MLNDFASHRSLARSLSPTPFTPHVTMATPLLDKIHIAYNAPYALGNMLAPGAWEPIMPKMVEAPQSRKLFRFLGVMGAGSVATAVVGLKCSDKNTKAKLDLIAGATSLGVAGALANMSASEDFGGPAPDAFKYGNIAGNVLIGAALIKRGIDNV
jgi:hypothetical protein|mmetsp:Transcript_1852/g.6392  ORF Transcript_1852/g.6392 Transcript_1852/m.6392 type:complete len:155 (-) Transcript_1852:1788-2252(-)